jgi:RNA polymerase sigma factor (sigma-70 family)
LDHDSRSDDELLQQYRGGDDLALGALYLRYQARLTAYVLSLFRGRPDLRARAAEVVQDAFVRVINSPAPADGRSHACSFLFRITHNLAFDLLRRPAGSQGAAEAADPSADPLTRLIEGEECLLLYHTLGELPPHQAEVIRLRYFEKLTLEEAAEVVGCSTTAVWRIERAALAGLKQLLGGG